MNRSYSDVYQGFIWWVEDIIDWIDALVDKYAHRGAHRGVYDWDIGTGPAFWEKGLPGGLKLRFVKGVPHYAWSGTVVLPKDEEPASAVLLLKPAEGLTGISVLGES